MKKSKLELKNFIWNIIGSTAFGFTSLFFMIIVTRINGLDKAGIFTYCFANACIFWTIASYSGRTFQVTESDENIKDTDYFYNRITTGVFSIIAVTVFCLLTKSTAEKFVLSLLLTIYRAIEAIIESMHAVVQRNGELYKAGISLFFRTIILVIAFIVVDLITNNIIVTSGFLIVINLFFLFFIDYNNIKNKFNKSKFDSQINKKLLHLGFSTFLYSFLSIYVSSATKYAINSFTTDDIQAIYGIIIMPASFLSMVSNYLIQPFLNKISSSINNKDKKELNKLLIRLSLGITFVGIMAIVLCYLIGIPILEFVYSTELKEQKVNLLIILAGSIFYSLAILLSSAFIAMRKTMEQLILLIVTALSALIISNQFVKFWGINGASISYLVVMFVEFALHFGTILIILYQKEKK